MERQLASVQRILALTPIPDADRIEAATVLGWRVVVKKGEFAVGDLCIFFEIDSILPFNPWTAFLKKPGEAETKPIRLRTVKMKKQISQGLALPPTMIPQLEGMTLVDGMDLTEILSITKYEPPYSGGYLSAKSYRPHWIPKTDEMRVQAIPWVIAAMNGADVYVTQKLDGSSMSLGHSLTGEKALTTRNTSLHLDADNRFTKVGVPLLEKVPAGYVVQGELVGPAIQNNRMGLKEAAFFVFNVIDLNKPGIQYLGWDDMLHFATKYGFEVVPLIHRGPWKWDTVDALLAFAEQRSYTNGHPQEGIVIRYCIPQWHVDLGLFSFKAINNQFLLKIGE